MSGKTDNNPKDNETNSSTGSAYEQFVMKAGGEQLEGEAVQLHYVPISKVILWKENPKKHDIGAIQQSIQTYGFKDPPAFDTTLEGLVEGNGRAEALYKMEKEKLEMPRGILKHQETGEWLMPILFGIDLKSKSLAQRYAIDHNNLVLSGGDLTATDIARIWDKDLYKTLLQGFVNENTALITMDFDDISAFVEREDGIVDWDNSSLGSGDALGSDPSNRNSGLDGDRDFFIVKLTFNNVSLKDDIVEQLEELLAANIGWDGSIHVDGE